MGMASADLDSGFTAKVISAAALIQGPINSGAEKSGFGRYRRLFRRNASSRETSRSEPKSKP